MLCKIYKSCSKLDFIYLDGDLIKRIKTKLLQMLIEIFSTISI